MIVKYPVSPSICSYTARTHRTCGEVCSVEAQAEAALVQTPLLRPLEKCSDSGSRLGVIVRCGFV